MNVNKIYINMPNRCNYINKKKNGNIKNELNLK